MYGRLPEGQTSTIRTWFDAAEGFMAEYDPSMDSPAEFEHALLRRSLGNFHRRYGKQKLRTAEVTGTK